MREWIYNPVAPLNTQARSAAQERQGQLTKPPGSLGQLEEIALQLAAMQGREKPAVEQPFIAIFAGDHGVAAEGVSAFPQEVTAQMIGNFANGGAAISVLAKLHGAAFEVVNLGTVTKTPMPGVINLELGEGTANMATEPAMSEQQLAAALQAGSDSVTRALAANCDLFIGGEMGIANTTAATALGSALSGVSVADLVGPGTGLDSHGVDHKRLVIEASLALHRDSQLPLEWLRRVGGFELAALAGAYIASAQRGLPALVDGFICTAAALAACAINPEVRQWLLFSHGSAEPGHQQLLENLDATPLLDIGLRLGEGSGAALTLPLIQQACQLHAGMATFAEAMVAGKIDGQ